MIQAVPTRLGDVLAPVQRRTPVDPTQQYPLLGVRLDGRGAFLRETVAGSATAARSLNKVAVGDFIYSRLFAWRGAFGVVTPELDGCYVSAEFPTFRIISDRVDLSYLLSWFRLPSTRSLVRSVSFGSTAITRNRLRPDRLLGLSIPLPPREEQARIAAELEGIGRRLAEVEVLRNQVSAQGEALCRSVLTSDGHSVPTPLGQLLTLRSPDVSVRGDESYQFAGVYSFGRGVFRSGIRHGADISYARLTTLRSGDFVYPKLMAWEGSFGVVPPECDGCVVSTEFPVFEIDETRMFHEVLDTHFRTPSVWPRIAGSSTGTNVRRRRLHPREFLAYELPLPGRRTQERLRSIRSKVVALQQQQANVADEIATLYSSILERSFRWQETARPESTR